MRSPRGLLAKVSNAAIELSSGYPTARRCTAPFLVASAPESSPSVWVGAPDCASFPRSSNELAHARRSCPPRPRSARPPKLRPDLACVQSSSSTTSTTAPRVDDGPLGNPSGRNIGPSELWLLNSTSGTTGLPKCVMQTMNRWRYFHQKAVDFGDLGETDVWMSVVPAPFGFGLWTAHVSPTLLGVPCVVTSRFDAEQAVTDIAKHRVTVLAAVSSQFVMMLDAAGDRDLSSLRVLFTGGEAISPVRAREFEQRTGCRVLNFYGSNETGMLSGTRADDPLERRLTTAGRVVAEMQVRLYGTDGKRVPGDVGEGRPACKGPATALGYWNDDDGNRELFTDDGWMFMGDVVRIDDDGWLSVVARTADFIIRGGKNISAPAVEDEVATHPAVSLVAAVPVPDARLGERVGVFVELRPGHELDLPELIAHLDARGVSREWWPEYLWVLPHLPRSSGEKVAKAELRTIAISMS